MPFFSSKFSPKKTPLRKSTNNLASGVKLKELTGENRKINLKLGNQVLVFENGEWIPESGKNGNLIRTTQKLQNKNQELEEENNFLKVKLEILIDMLTQAAIDNENIKEEMEKLKNDSENLD